jgi:hypothetical protein
MLPPYGKRYSISSVILVTLFVAVFYCIFTVVALGIHNWDPLWFVWLGEKYADLNPNGRTGYDGQFIFYIARYGSKAVPHLDNPSYRLQRILLPVMVRVFSVGASSLVPWMIILINLIAIVATTYLLAEWLDENDLSPWYALMYALYIGTFMAYSRDLTEPLALCLAAWGAVLWFREKSGWAALSLALAALAKETTLLFVFGIACSSLVRQRPRSAIRAMVAILPLLVWEGYLAAKLGDIPLVAGPTLERGPLSGIISHLNLEPGRLSGLVFVGLPALALLTFSLLSLLRQRKHSPIAWWLFLHSVFVVLLPFNVYDHIMHAGRNAGGMVLSVLFILPLFAKPLRFFFLSYWVFPTFLWLIPILRWAPWLSEI